MATNAWSKTDRGLKREGNQDSFIASPDIGLFVVADGMGGHSGGEVASKMAVEAIDGSLRQPRLQKSPRESLVEGYAEASRRIFDKAAYEQPELLGMGTTMVSILQSGNSIFVGNVGDSRCYLYRKPHLWQLTEDHSIVNEQLRAGLINEQQAKTFLGRNVITRSVGYEREVSVDVLERPFTAGDVFLLCSDGLSGLVSDQKMAEIFNRNPLEVAADVLLQTALENGGDDNVTVMIVAP